MINNRQNGRRRGRGNNNNGQRGGNPGRPDSGNRIDSRARGNANQLYEKYKNLARDAQMQGDRVNTEYYLQFADHYFRVLSETRLRFEEQNPNAPQQRRIQPVDSFDDFDEADDYGDEGEPIRNGEQAGDPRGQQHNGNRDQQRPREMRRDEGRDGNRDGGRYDARRDEPRGGEERDRPERNGSAAPRQDRDDRYLAPATPVANDRGEESPDDAGPEPIVPRRRGRPPRAAAAEVVEVFDADRLPPSLTPQAVAAEGDEEAPRPRRRRGRPAAGEASQAG